jgi:hypothetical protein
VRQKLEDFYTAFKTGFNPANPIKAWFDGFPSQTSTITPYLAFVVDKGNIERENFSSSKKEVNGLIFIGINKDLEAQGKLLEYVDELDEFFRINPRLGGVDMIDFYDFDIDTTNGTGLMLGQIRITILED